MLLPEKWYFCGGLVKIKSRLSSKSAGAREALFLSVLEVQEFPHSFSGSLMIIDPIRDNNDYLVWAYARSLRSLSTQ